MTDSTTGPGRRRSAQRAGGARRTKPAQVRRDELMAAAERLFLAQGVEATTVEQITRAAGVAKGSFYLQFATREELREALRRRFVEDYLEELDAVLAGVPEDQHAARLAVWTAVTLSVFLERAALRALLFEGPRAYAAAGHDGVLERLVGLLAAGTRAGAWSLPDTGDVATFLFHGLLGLLDDPVGGRGREALEESAIALVERLVLAG